MNFNKIWGNIKISNDGIEVDTSNNFVVKEIEGDILQILELDSKKVLIIENKNKLQLIDPLTFSVIDKPISLASIKTSVTNIQFIKVDNKWSVVCVYDHSQVIIYNFETKKKSTLCKSEDRISNLFVYETDGIAYTLVIANQGDTILKYNLNTQSEELQFNTGYNSAYFKFYLLNNNQPTLLLYKSDSGNRLYQVIDANTGTLIGEKICLEGESDTVKDQMVVEVDHNKSVLVIAKKQHLLLFDIVTGKQIYNIIIDEDPQYSVGWSNALTTYHSKLIIGSKQEVKVFDLRYPNQAPLNFKYVNDQKVGYFEQLVQGYYQGKDILIAECSIPNEEGQTTRPSLMFDLETLREIEDIHIIGDLAPSNMSFKIRNLLPFIDEEGRELFFSKYSNDDESSTILWNPKGRIPQEVETIDYLKLISTIVDNEEIIIAHKSNNQLCLINSNIGLEINSMQLSGYISHIKVEEIEGKQQLLVLADNKIQGYSLPEFSPTNVIVDDMLDYSFFDIYDGKIVAGSESDIHTWRLDRLDTPERLIVVDVDDEEISAISKITVLKLQNQEYLFISNYESFTYLYNPETNKVGEFDVDDTMWNVNEDDPDYCMYEAVIAKTSKGEQIVTASHHGAISIYDPNTFKRKGKIMQTHESVYADFLYLSSVNDIQYLVTPESYSVTIWDIDSRKKLKEFYFEEPITAITTISNKIIVAQGENIQAIEVTI